MASIRLTQPASAYVITIFAVLEFSALAMLTDSGSSAPESNPTANPRRGRKGSVASILASAKQRSARLSFRGRSSSVASNASDSQASSVGSEDAEPGAPPRRGSFFGPRPALDLAEFSGHWVDDKNYKNWVDIHVIDDQTLNYVRTCPEKIQHWEVKLNVPHPAVLRSDDHRTIESTFTLTKNKLIATDQIHDGCLQTNGANNRRSSRSRNYEARHHNVHQYTYVLSKDRVLTMKDGHTSYRFIHDGESICTAKPGTVMAETLERFNAALANLEAERRAKDEATANVTAPPAKRKSRKSKPDIPNESQKNQVAGGSPKNAAKKSSQNGLPTSPGGDGKAMSDSPKPPNGKTVANTEKAASLASRKSGTASIKPYAASTASSRKRSTTRGTPDSQKSVRQRRSGSQRRRTSSSGGSSLLRTANVKTTMSAASVSTRGKRQSKRNRVG